MSANPDTQAWIKGLEKLLDEDVSLETLDSWLERWDRIERERAEYEVDVYRFRHLDSGDTEARSRLTEYLGITLPALRQIMLRLKQRFLDTISGTELDGFYTFQALFESDVRELKDVDAGLEGEAQTIVESLSKRNDEIRAELNGQYLTPTEVKDVLLRGERTSREQVWRSTWDQKLEGATELEGVFERAVSLRHRIATRAGFQDYREYRFQATGGYSPGIAQTFQETVLVGVQPTVRALADHRMAALGVDQLRPWDKDIGLPEAQLADNTLTGRDVVRRLLTAIRPLSPELADAIKGFPEEAFELERRPNKSNQGFAVYYPIRGYPLMFATYRGNSTSLATLIHELGHAVNSALMAPRTKYSFDHQSNLHSCFGECVAFFFELFTLNLLPTSKCEIIADSQLHAIKREKAARFADRLQNVARIELLEHFTYGSGGVLVSPSMIRERFKDLESTYPDGIDRRGLDAYDRVRWIEYRSLRDPFTLGLYGHGVIGALAHYAAFLTDPEGSLESFVNALEMPESCPDTILFEALGLRYPFTADVVSQALDVLGSLVS